MQIVRGARGDGGGFLTQLLLDKNVMGSRYGFLLKSSFNIDVKNGGHNGSRTYLFYLN